MSLFGKKNNLTKSSLASSLNDEKLKSNIILNAIEDGVVLIDNQKTIQLFNPAASTISGWPSNEAEGLSFELVLTLIDDKGQPYPASDHPFIKALSATDGATIRDNRATLVTRSKSNVSIDISVSPLKDQAGVITGAVGVFRDVSEARKEEKQSAEFISTASHEMRTPVAAIEGYLALALNDKVSKIDAKARDYLLKAHASTQHLGKLFQDLLTSAKAEDGRLSSHPVIIELSEYLDKLTDDLKFSAEKKGLQTEFLLGAVIPGEAVDAATSADSKNVIKPLYFTLADPDRLREVITNLFDNAVKYTESGKITIGLTGNNEVVQFRISDTGPGIPKEDIPHLFQKFYRVDNSATRTIGGTGLGLFICRKIIELYNGRIWVESEIDHGSTFYINLPRTSTERAIQLQTEQSKEQVSPLSSTANL